MKFSILSLIFLAACSSAPEKSAKKPVPVVKNEAFNKVKPLTASEISEFYQGNTQSLTPALQDETLDRYSQEELDKLNISADPLMQMSVLCSRRDFAAAFQLAASHFNRYQKVAPYWNQVANCHLNQGSHRKALLFYNKAIEVKANFVPALNNIGVMYARQDQDQKALVAFERANLQSKFSKTPRYNMAKLYLTYGLAESALPVFQNLLSESPKDVDLLNAVGSSYFLLSDYGQALSYFKQIPQSEWSRAEIGLNLSFTLNKLGKSEEAADVFARVEKPKKANLKRYYSTVEAQLGDVK